MISFMNEDFLLKNEVSKKLYHEYAKDMPIFDYHCHLNPKEIAENKGYDNLTQIWLYGDHYKWRAMRSNGIDEKYITGDASDYEKFLAFVETIEYCFGNPLYHWSHLELKRFFGIDEVINRKNAEVIWNKANELLRTPEFTTKNLIKRANVTALCTTDDPIDSLEYHLEIAQDKEFGVKVLPTYRPDKAMGYQACCNSEKNCIQEGNCGAGTGASVGKYRGMDRAMKSGLGIYCVELENLKVGAIVGVNAIGNVIDSETNKFLAGLLNEEKTEIISTREEMWKDLDINYSVLKNTNTTIGCIITNAKLTKAQATKIASMTHNGYARAISPVHTSLDGDTIFTLGTGEER